AVRAFSSARRAESARGVSRFFGVSSTSIGLRRSGTMPACSSSARRRGEALARTSLTLVSVMMMRLRDRRDGSFEPVGDTAFCKIVGCHLDHDLVARQDPDSVLAHLACGVSNDLMTIVELYPEGCIGQ